MAFINSNKNVLLTTPIFYPNGEPHVGTITTVIIVDFLNRSFKKFQYNTKFITGNDEHGQKVLSTAQNKNIDPQIYVNNIANNFQDMFSKLKIQYDMFYRTTDQKHKDTVQYIWKILLEKKLIYKSQYSGLYSQSQEAFIDDISEDPNAVHITEDVYFFKMSMFQEKLEAILKNNNFVIPEKRANELLGFMKNGLKDLCISRERLSWGIKVPNEQKGVIYVWLDALTNYINGCNFPNLDQYWSNVIHVIGKDISIFHGIYWICILLALDLYPEKLQLLIHNWWILDGKKSSKSSGNIIDPKGLLEKYPIAVIRFYIIYNNLITQDSIFEEKNLVPLYNSLLVNKVSNLIYRVILLRKKHNMNIEVPKTLTKNTFTQQMENLLLQLNINGYLKCLLNRADQLNTYVEKYKLWENPELTNDIIEDIYNIFHLIEAIDPTISQIDTILFQKIK